MKRISKEVKIDVSKIDILYRLRKNKAVLIGGNKEITTRYDTEDMCYEKKGKFIRTRQGFENIITLKEKNEENDSVFERDEFEVKIDDIENMQKILETLNVKPVLIMEKYRLKWVLEGVKINLDELSFGVYLEIHGEKEEIDRTIDILGLENQEVLIETYWELYKKYRIVNNIKNEKNIKFPNGYEFKLLG